jgi:hypothetical protein
MGLDLSEAFAPTNPTGAHALDKEFPTSALRVIQGQSNSPSPMAPKD